MSDDGLYAVSIIAFVGSVFSPYYAAAFKAAERDPKRMYPVPDDYCCLNVALYSKGAKRWTMTERAKRFNNRSASEFVIGPSQLRWDGQALHIDIKEISVPIPRKVVGRITVHPEQLFNFSTPLDIMGMHRWGPIAPRARVEVSFYSPKQKWQGNAYLDSNEGDEPIAKAFKEWDWSRCNLRGSDSAVIYDVQPKSGEDRLLALRFKANGEVEPFSAPERQTMPKTFWGIERRMRAEEALGPIHQLEDTPFYQRAVVDSRILGESVQSFHETLNARRFEQKIVQAMLPWRMPRVR
jgi:carotenoid 1,2-hydratase